MNLLEAVSTSGVSGNLTDDVTMPSSSSPMVSEAGITGVTDELPTLVEKHDVSGTPMDLDKKTSPWMTDTVSDVKLQL